MWRSWVKKNPQIGCANKRIEPSKIPRMGRRGWIKDLVLHFWKLWLKAAWKSNTFLFFPLIIEHENFIEECVSKTTCSGHLVFCMGSTQGRGDATRAPRYLSPSRTLLPARASTSAPFILLPKAISHTTENPWPVSVCQDFCCAILMGPPCNFSCPVGLGRFLNVNR